MTIDENLMRQGLSVAQTAIQTARRKEIYEELHPETKAGVAGVIATNRKLGRGGATKDATDTVSVASFVANTAEVTGRNPRSVSRDAMIGKALGDELLLVEGTSLDNSRDLTAMARMTPEERRPLIERARAGEKVSARRSQCRTSVCIGGSGLSGNGSRKAAA